MGCATGIVKIIVFLFNFLCSIVGLILITLGAIGYVASNKADDVVGESYVAIPASVIALGVIIFIISFLGCCGVCQKSSCMLTTYSVLLLTLFVVQLALGIYGVVQYNDNKDLRKDFNDALKESFQKYPKDEVVQEYFNIFQEELKCCAVNGPLDYAGIGKPIPESCCGKDNQIKFCGGCGDKIYNTIEDAIKIIAYVALGICAIELVGAIFAYCLVNSYKNEGRRGV